MNILLLSNSAPNYHHFFNALAACFQQDGARITVAVDSDFSRTENQLDSKGFATIAEFAAFHASHRTDHAILARYACYDLNRALLSDFERAEVYGVWGEDIDLDFYDRLKSALLSFFEALFQKHAINLVLYENVSNSFAHFALFVAQAHGATYCGIGGSRLPNRCSITSDPLDDHVVQDRFEAIRAGTLAVEPEVRQWATDYIAGIETYVPDYMKINGLDKVSLIERYLHRDRLDKLRALLRYAGTDRKTNFQIGNPLRTHFNLFRRNVERRMRLSAVQKLYQAPVTGEQFLLYPMHFHPESSTSILAGTYLDEYEVIRNIAFSLPEGVRLYVKDHLSAWGYPSLEMYKRIRRLPNVRLLAPDQPTKQLIKQAKAVITLTSTVGFEALLLKKRVFLYGRVFYEFHKGVVRISDPACLGALLRTHLDAPVDWDDAYNTDMVSAYYKATLPVGLNLLQKGDSAAANARAIYDALLQSDFCPQEIANG